MPQLQYLISSYNNIFKIKSYITHSQWEVCMHLVEMAVREVLEEAVAVEPLSNANYFRIYKLYSNFACSMQHTYFTNDFDKFNF